MSHGVYVMAQRTTVEYVDDLEGTSSGDVQTVKFGLDGVTYEIDLNSENANSLRESLSGYVNAARRTGGRRRSSAIVRGADDRSRSKAIREWAAANGHDVSERGRLAASLVAAYQAAQDEPSPATAPAEVKPRRRATAKAASAPAEPVAKRRKGRKAEPVFSG